MTLLSLLCEMDLLSDPTPSNMFHTSHGCFNSQENQQRRNILKDSLESYIELQSLNDLLQETAKLIVGQGLGDHCLSILAHFLNKKYTNEIDSKIADLAGDLLERGLLLQHVNYHQSMAKSICNHFGKPQIITLEGLLDRYQDDPNTLETIYSFFRYTLDPSIPEYINLKVDMLPQSELYGKLRQIGKDQYNLPVVNTNTLPEIITLLERQNGINPQSLSILRQQDPSIVEHIGLVLSVGDYREQIQLDGGILSLLGPANPTKTCSFIAVLNQGGERMLFDYHYDPDTDDDCYINIIWFTGQCQNIDCLRPINYFWEAKRIPMPMGGWKGCYCSFHCARVGASQMQDQFEYYQEDGIDRLVPIDDSDEHYLPEEWDQLFEHMEELMEKHPITPRDNDHESSAIIAEVFTNLGKYLANKYPYIDPTWFDQMEVTPFLNYSPNNYLDISGLVKVN